MAKRRKRDFYFDKKEEQAVIDYANSNSKIERDRIYNEILKSYVWYSGHEEGETGLFLQRDSR